MRCSAVKNTGNLLARHSRTNAKPIMTTLYLSAKCMIGTLMAIIAKTDMSMEMVIIA